LENAEALFERKRKSAVLSRTNAFISLCDYETPEKEGILSNTVFGIKDNIAVRGMKLTCASNMLSNYVSPYDATVVSRLKAEGALILGKNNMDEFACGSSGENSAFGPTLNPVFEGLVPGGSSSGSAASVAEGTVDASLGSDTGGSVRCPSSFCCTVGLKPSYGMVSRYGLVDLSMSLESPAPIVPWGAEELLARIMDVISGPDPRDQATANASKTECVRHLEDISPESISVAIPENVLNLCTLEVQSSFRSFVSFLQDAGASVQRCSLETIDIALPCYYIIMYSEFASAMQRYDGLKFGYSSDAASVEERIVKSRMMLGNEVKRRILLGTYITSAEGRSAWYQRALAARNAVTSELRSLTDEYDFILMPTMPLGPYPFGSRLSPVEMYATDALTVPSNLAGLPSLSFPISPGIGAQLIAGHGKDEELVAALHAIRMEGWKWKSTA